MDQQRTADVDVSNEDAERLRLVDVRFELERLKDDGMPVSFLKGKVELPHLALVPMSLLALWGFVSNSEIMGSLTEPGGAERLAAGWWRTPVVIVAGAWLWLVLVAYLLPHRERAHQRYRLWLKDNIRQSGIAELIIAGWAALPAIASPAAWPGLRIPPRQPDSDRGWIRYVVKYLHLYLKQPHDPFPNLVLKWLGRSGAFYQWIIIFVLMILVTLVSSSADVFEFTILFNVLTFIDLYILMPFVIIMYIRYLLSLVMGDQYPNGIKATLLLEQLLPSLPELPPGLPPPPEQPPLKSRVDTDWNQMNKDWKWPGR